MLEELKDDVCRANEALVIHGLVTLTWGNVSGICPDRQYVAIKPSGVPYHRLTPDDIVIVDLDGNVIDGELRPSSDAPTHVALYRRFQGIGGIVHTHSRYATAFAQARREIPCLGTTHADHFVGPVPLARDLTPEEIEAGYETNTGNVIIERFEDLDPLEVPGILLPGHAPFAWGEDVAGALDNAIALEAVAEMAYATLALDPAIGELDEHLRAKHYRRKHGKHAYYGQE